MYVFVLDSVIFLIASKFPINAFVYIFLKLVSPPNAVIISDAEEIEIRFVTSNGIFTIIFFKSFLVTKVTLSTS